MQKNMRVFICDSVLTSSGSKHKTNTKNNRQTSRKRLFTKSTRSSQAKHMSQEYLTQLHGNKLITNNQQYQQPCTRGAEITSVSHIHIHLQLHPALIEPQTESDYPIVKPSKQTSLLEWASHSNGCGTSDCQTSQRLVFKRDLSSSQHCITHSKRVDSCVSLAYQLVSRAGTHRESSHFLHEFV